VTTAAFVAIASTVSTGSVGCVLWTRTLRSGACATALTRLLISLAVCLPASDLEPVRATSVVVFGVSATASALAVEPSSPVTSLTCCLCRGFFAESP